MSRWRGSGKTTCESCAAIDIRRWHRSGRLRSPWPFSLSWTRDGEPSGSIRVEASAQRAVLVYRSRSYGADWENVRQEVPIVWTACTLGGERPWFRCSVYASGVYCGRRVAKLYAAGKLFACRHCYQLAYESQQDAPHMRGIGQAQKIRMRLGGSGSLDESFPPKPKHMHWRTYHALENRALAAEAEADAQAVVWFSRWSSRPGKLE